MKILQVNKFGTATSGAENYFLRLSERMINDGHDVAMLCMRPQDVSPQARLFEVSDIDFRASRTPYALASSVRRVWDAPIARDVMRHALRSFSPDVVHFHNIAHQLSHAIVEDARDAGVATVMTCHDYKLICPAYTALRDDRPCFTCADASPASCLRYSCLHGSRSWSGLAAAEAMRTRHRAPRTIPAVLIAPSEFMARQLRGSWLANYPVDIRTVANPVDPPSLARTMSEGVGGIYVGRLSAEKGLELAIRAAAESGVPLSIVGDGPQRLELEQVSKALRAPVTFWGFQTADDLEARWADAAFQVMPSMWPENAPLAAIEGGMRGLPLIAADSGGLPEIVARSGSGVLVPPGDVTAWAAAMRDGATGTIGTPDRHALEEAHSWQRNVDAATRIYEETQCAWG